MDSKLDFSTLSLQDALDIAILIEVEAGERYEELAGQLETHRTTEAAEFFRAMVTEEAKHGDELRSQRRKLFGDAPPRIDASSVPEIEAPDYDEARAFMTPRDALQVALKCEERARDFYADALEYVTEQAVKALLTQLHNEEISHVAHVLRILKTLPAAETTRPEDFVDEPIAQ